MEKLIFGEFRRIYWEESEKILNLDSWSKSPPLFNQEELSKMNELNIVNYQMSGLYPKQ